MDQIEEAESLVKKRIKQEPKSSWLYVEYGNLLERRSQFEEAGKQFEKAIETMPADQNEVYKLSSALMGGSRYDLAIAAYEKGNKLFNDRTLFAYELGEAYRLKGDIPRMVENYLFSLERMPQRLTNVQAYFQRQSDQTGMDELQLQLIERAQTQPDNTLWPEMLAWVFIQRKDYRNAFRQVTALDRRLEENGGRIFKLARTARSEKDYDAAIEGYKYIIEKKGESCPYFLDANRELLASNRARLTARYDYTLAEVQQVESDYLTFLERFGRNRETAPTILELAQLEAFYLRNLPKAIALLNEVVAMPFNPGNAQERDLLAQAKLDLGDYYLMNGENWESTLLYSQVDKALKDAPLGEMARYKNAKLSYYTGDFEWAQGQLGALKASTSELISNDAIDLSVFIMDHYGLDTVATPMEMFARAELLNFQNRYDESFSVLDSITTQFKGHTLTEAIWFVKADIYIKQRKYEPAVALLDTLIASYKEGILADNAIMRLAQVNEGPLANPKRAMELYDRIITEYPSSIFVIEARKRFRFLRGDKLEGVQ
jgi:hypothetical protein